MSEDEIKEVDAWFDSHTEYYGTYHSDDEYSVCSYDLESFTDFLRDRFPDIVGVRCWLGKGDSAIWFFRDDLENVSFI